MNGEVVYVKICPSCGSIRFQEHYASAWIVFTYDEQGETILDIDETEYLDAQECRACKTDMRSLNHLEIPIKLWRRLYHMENEERLGNIVKYMRHGEIPLDKRFIEAVAKKHGDTLKI